ncbi:hypothetical protein E4U59_002564 [Claviceps monticola]|nr:hypothetical protein E4U59_002564 [Claviceps monticola]
MTLWTVGRDVTAQDPTLEVERLQVRSRGIDGVAKLVGHRQITSSTEMRKGLKFGEPHKFRLSDLVFSGTSRDVTVQDPTLDEHSSSSLTVIKSLMTRPTGDIKWQENILSSHSFSPELSETGSGTPLDASFLVNGIAMYSIPKVDFPACDGFDADVPPGMFEESRRLRSKEETCAACRTPIPSASL